MDCQKIAFSQNQSQKRMKKVLQVMPVQVLKKLLFFSLYVLGARLNTIASLVHMPTESGKTTINRVMKDGLPAFHDRRKSVYELPLLDKQSHKTSVSIHEGFCIIKFGESGCQLKIQQSHRVHLRAVLLSLMHADLLSIQTVSSVLGITKAHCRELSAKLAKNGATQVLVDKRKGQKQDFRVDLSIKAELIKHFSARAVTGHSISSQVLTQIINNSLNVCISSRTIRWHMHKMGLAKIKKALPELAGTLKKTAEDTQ
ncbi:MAG: hypothetical protein U9Q69_04135 [Nanoarchaeota archaeon]|nr:hypothetical protein [Nanoarchaeota archaeon]